ncbi:TadE/TadG family type IV pilus assembly protein [Caulobacter sp. 17J65-9]|uniref:TadE/TadG family type IV pilus assembly protein n=1 Tax=Caulobacter sp. 17J65-9 TaxID=2709382 RepID=UPI0013C6889E|nr:pilus assembly protein [Caulobacter sp. 17J65-9]
MSADRQKTRRPRFGRDESGATAVEFAIVGPIFLMLLFVLINFGWAMHCASSVRYATEESARALAIDADVTPAVIRADIVKRLTQIADPDVTVTVTKDRSTPKLQVADVVTSYKHHIGSPWIPAYTVNFKTEVSIATPLFE